MIKGKAAKAKSALSRRQKGKADAVAEMVTVYIMGKAAQVPSDATIMGAIEYAGHTIVRGAGCREGYCGACATVYRMPGDYKMHMGLACMTLVKPGMSLAQFPSIPARKEIYDIKKVKPGVEAFRKYYPEVFRCVSCNTCTKACVQGLQVMDYVNAAMRGDVAKVMDLSFDCVGCQMCTIRCPAEITQPAVGMLAKRLYGRYLRKESKELAKRLRDVKKGAFDAEYKELMSMSKKELSDRYYARDME